MSKLMGKAVVPFLAGAGAALLLLVPPAGVAVLATAAGVSLAKHRSAQRNKAIDAPADTRPGTKSAKSNRSERATPTKNPGIVLTGDGPVPSGQFKVFPVDTWKAILEEVVVRRAAAERRQQLAAQVNDLVTPEWSPEAQGRQELGSRIAGRFVKWMVIPAVAALATTIVVGAAVPVAAALVGSYLLGAAGVVGAVGIAGFFAGNHLYASTPYSAPPSPQARQRVEELISQDAVELATQIDSGARLETLIGQTEGGLSVVGSGMGADLEAALSAPQPEATIGQGSPAGKADLGLGGMKLA